MHIFQYKMTFIPRKSLFEAIRSSVTRYPVTVLLGPRQVGKTTLAREFASSENRLDLESPLDLARLAPDAFGLLASLKGLVVIDEIQTMPELFQYIRVIVDEPDCPTRFLLTGSASPALVEKTAESLAGRVRLFELGGFSMAEVGASEWERLWFRGGFPRAFLAEAAGAEARNRPAVDPAMEWLDSYLKTFVLRDIQQLAGGRLPTQLLSQFLVLLAHYHGREWNRSEVASALSIDAKTVDRYMDVFLGAYLIRELRPYVSNIKKRIRKSSRYYIRDSGLLHCLLRIGSFELLRSNPSFGASWEGFGIEQVIRQLGCAEEDCFFWRTHAGAEIDLLVAQGDKLLGIEFKASSAPKVTAGSRTAIEDLGLERLYVVHPGPHRFKISEDITALPMRNLPDILPAS